MSSDASPLASFITGLAATIDFTDNESAGDDSDRFPSHQPDEAPTGVSRCRFAEPEAASSFFLRTSCTNRSRLRKSRADHVCMCARHRGHLLNNSVPLAAEASNDSPSAAPLEFRKFHTVGGSLRRQFYGLMSSVTAGGGDAVHFTRDPYALAARSGEGNLLTDDPYIAIVDTGANRHLVNRHIDLMNRRRTNLWMTSSNGSRTKIDTAGDYELQAADENGVPLEPLLLKDASRLSGSPLNLVSVGVLCEQGTTFHFEKKNSYFIYKGKRFKLEERDGLYLIRLDCILQAEDLKELCAAQEIHDPYALSATTYGCAATYDMWHERFGHASKKRLKFLYENGSVEGMDVYGKYKHDNLCKCATCLINNNAKLHIGDSRKFSDHVTQRGELIYTDLCGPFPLSVEGYRYVISFTDVYSRFSCCYFLQEKSEAEQALLALIRYYRKEGAVIKRIRGDQGGEFGGHHERSSNSGESNTRLKTDAKTWFAFQRICEENDITYEPTPADRPELHGLAERWNRTITRMANAMLYASRLSHILWPAAFSHANMLRNRLPVRGLGRYTPYELFFHKRPRVENLRVFGCDAYKLLPIYPKVPGQMARKRLIYCGETADRMGFRCFDPIEFKFTTEFELIFDEASAKKRINALREYDIRRELLRRGKLADLPLESSDSVLLDATQSIERSVFSSPPSNPPPTEVVVDARGGRGDGVESALDKDEKGRSFKSEGPGGRRQRADNERAGQSSRPEDKKSLKSIDTTVHATEAINPNNHDRRTPIDELRTSPLQGADSCMGSDAAPPEDDHESTRDHHSPTNTMISDCSENGLKITGPSLRPGRKLMNLRTAGDGLDLKFELTDQDEADIALNDEEAAKFGPLTEEQLMIERARSGFDPRHPRRPLRILPIGIEEVDSDEFREFRTYALEHDFMIKFVDNPKQVKSKSWHRYEKYRLGKTMREMIELSVAAADPKRRREARALALKDLVNDALRGYILFPQHENNSGTHFVNAGDLARECSTINIHALYSGYELDDLRKKAKEEENARLKELIDEHLEREAKKGPEMTLKTFNEKVKCLWDYDPLLQLHDGDLKQEALFATSLVSKLMTGDLPEPNSYRSAVASDHPERTQWIESMGRERSTLSDRGTWVMVPRSSCGRHRPVRCKYVYKKKTNKDGSLQYKSRLVACGYSQIAGMDYFSDQTYAGVCSYPSMRFLMSLACQKGYILSQTDITGAYLESYLDETIFMEPPPDMFMNGQPPRDPKTGEELVCLLKRGLYGLKQAGYAWSQVFKEFLLRDPTYSMGFVEFTGEPNMYRKTFKLNGKEEEIIIGIYVDDCLIASSSEEARKWFMERLEARFPVNPKSSGLITWDSPGLVLSMHVRYDRLKGILELNQIAAIEALAKKINVTDDAPRSLPITENVRLPKLAKPEVSQTDYLSVVGSTLHICQVSRPDCAFAVGVLSRHSATPGAAHMIAARNLVNYLYNSRQLCIRYCRSKHGNMPDIYEKGSEVAKKTMEERLVASIPIEASNSADMYVDADFAGDPNTRRSTSGMVIILNQGPISWWSRIQKLCAQSSTESEIYAATESVKEAIHIKLLCEESGIRVSNNPIVIWEDNNACIQMGHGLRGSKSAKHYEIRLRFLNEHILNKTIEFARIDTKDQLADGFTKALKEQAFFAFRGKLLKPPFRQ